VTEPERVDPGALRRIARRLRPHGPWPLYVAAGALASTYLNLRTLVVPRPGEWYSGDSLPPVLLQLRAWFSGRLAPISHPEGGWYDFVWGRRGIHTNWGLGLPILGIPFHAVARLFGAPGFPDHVRFLILYGVTMMLFTRALHGTARKEPTALIASVVAAGFFLVFPTFVGLIGARFLIYEQTIAVGALWSVLLLAGIFVMLERSTTPRLVMVCAAAAFAMFIRPTLAVYGLTTAALAIYIAHRRGLRIRGLIAGASAGAVVAALYLASNYVRFGAAFDPGYANITSEQVVNRVTRWGVSFTSLPLRTTAKEMFATLFLLGPVATQVISRVSGGLPAGVAPYAVGERWREYYSPTYDPWILAAWIAMVAVVSWRIVRGRAWSRDSDIGEQVPTIVGVWALPPSIVLFVFYAKIGNLATRYLVDLYPAFAAALLCVGMAFVDGVRKRAPGQVATAQLAITAIAGLYLSGGRGWAFQLSRPSTRGVVEAKLAELDARSAEQPAPASHLRCGETRGPEFIYGHLAGWLGDCSFPSGMVFAMPRSPCMTFTFRAHRGSAWGPADDESLNGFRAHADFDALVSCGAPKVEGDTRSLEMCEPRPPRFLLDGLRLYSIASLDAQLRPIDRLKLMRIDPSPACQ
jgi:hypothetical protein